MNTFPGLRCGWLGLLLLLFSSFAGAVTPQTMTVTCGGAKNQKKEQTGLIRAKFDNGTWDYNLVADGDLKLKDVVWSYPGKGDAASGWGGTTETIVQPEKSYQLAWTSPLGTAAAANTGNFKVMVTGKRVCPGGVPGIGGEGEEDTFEIIWDADVVGVKILKDGVDLLIRKLTLKA